MHCLSVTQRRKCALGRDVSPAFAVAKQRLRAGRKAGVVKNHFVELMSFFTYILECSDGKYYTGYSDDLDARVESHNTGEYPNAYTLRRRPVKLVFYMEFEDVDSAKEFERQIKKWTRAKMMQ